MILILIGTKIQAQSLLGQSEKQIKEYYKVHSSLGVLDSGKIDAGTKYQANYLAFQYHNKVVTNYFFKGDSCYFYLFVGDYQDLTAMRDRFNSKFTRMQNGLWFDSKTCTYWALSVSKERGKIYVYNGFKLEDVGYQKL